MDYEKCYVYRPDPERPAKRRRVDEGLQSSWPARRRLLNSAWAVKQTLIDEKLKALNEKVVDDICSSLDEAKSDLSTGSIPTSIVLAGPRSSHASILQQVSSQLVQDRDRAIASISPAEGTNLKNALKHVIQKATSREGGQDDDEDEEVRLVSKTKKRFLNYDLHALESFVRDNNIKQVLVSLDDTEGFSSEILAQLIDQLARWRDRIPFALLLTVATSIEMLQQRLPNATRRVLRGRPFLAPSAEQELQAVLDALMGGTTSISIGAAVMRNAMQRHSDYLQDIGGLIATIKYAHMSAFFANALTIFLDKNLSTPKKLTQDHFEALRTLPSFRSAMEDMIADGQIKEARKILDDDLTLHRFAIAQLNAGQEALQDIGKSLDLIVSLQAAASSSRNLSKPTLYLQAMAGKLRGSAHLKSLFLAVRKASPKALITLLEQWAEFKTGSRDFTMEDSEYMGPLAIALEQKHTQMRSMQEQIGRSSGQDPASMKQQQETYATLVRQFTDDLEAYVDKVLINPRTLAFNEILIYDLVSPIREVFTPRPRHAIERALASPHDYLDCDCCAEDGEEGTLSATQPATSVLYQIYLEAGNLLNVHDGWQAFQTIAGEDEDEQLTMARFQRALADLKHLGMVKGTRKRVDHVVKVQWKGL